MLYHAYINAPWVCREGCHSLSNGFLQLIWCAVANTFLLRGVFNYRGSKFDITLTPDDMPALYTYARSPNDDTVYYMSWNGATEVQSYNIYGRSSCDSDYTLIGNVTRTGFETNYTASGYQEYGMVEAAYANGTGIRSSTLRGVKAFVPSQQLSQYCDSNACQPVS